MAQMFCCDRCGSSPVSNVVRILERDLCSACVESLRNWLEPIAPSAKLPHEVRLDRALNMIKKQGYARSSQVSAALGEDERTTYLGLIHQSKKGVLEHRGRGVFVIPAKAAAE